MKYIILALVGFSVFHSKSQTKFSKQAQPIVEEGKLLYRSEMTSWLGTDVFVSVFENQDEIGGYFSYLEKDSSRCIFFNRSENPVVIGVITFEETFDLEKARLDLNRRVFSPIERQTYELRQKALSQLQSDTIFKHYKNTSFNIIPLAGNKESRVYILTGPQENGFVIFGNDYLLTFDKKLQLKDLKKLHNNVMFVEYGETEDGNEIVSSTHMHNETTGDFITATDICTLMLYGKITGWERHDVYSKNLYNTWNIKTESLFVLPMSTLRKINEDQEKREAEAEN